MKTSIFCLLLLTCGPALFGHPTDPLVARSEVSAQRIELQLTNLQQQPTLVSLVNLDQGPVYTNRVRKHNGYSLTLDLAELPAGRYLLQVKQGKVLRQQVVVKTAAGLISSDWK